MNFILYTDLASFVCAFNDDVRVIGETGERSSLRLADVLPAGMARLELAESCYVLLDEVLNRR